jgi:hypothetical protein
MNQNTCHNCMNMHNQTVYKQLVLWRLFTRLRVLGLAHQVTVSPVGQKTLTSDSIAMGSTAQKTTR